MKNLFDSIVRTIVPQIVTVALTLWALAGIEPDAEFAATLTAALYVAFNAIYYVAVRLLETYVTPKFGWLLGLAKAPEYSPDAALASLVDASDVEREASIQAAASRLLRRDLKH